jgi:hypothetical protein
MKKMGSFFSLFHCETFAGNRGYEDRFQWFFVSKDEKKSLPLIQQAEAARLIGKVRDQPSDHAAAMRLARILGVTLEPEAYELFLEDIGPVAIAIFYDNAVENSDGFPDFDKTKESHYRKYCVFKFASFLDLLCPGLVRWRGEAELESIPLVLKGLDQFQAADLQVRTSMLTRWILNPGPSAFSETRAKQSERILLRRAFLLKLNDLPAAKVAQRLDNAGFKPQRKFPSYTVWFHSRPQSFESWLSKERSQSRRIWRIRTPNPKSKLS